MFHIKRKSILALSAATALSGTISHAADIHWTNGIASYTNALDWDSNTVPGAGDNALSDNGAGTLVRINAGNPDWTVNDLRAGGEPNTTGAFEQNGQTVTLNGWLLIGDQSGAVGTFTLNAGTLNINTGRLLMGGGPSSTSTMNINGGVLNKSGGVIDIADGGWNGAMSRTGTVNQAGGTITSSDEIWVGQYGDGVNIGTAIYNLHAGGTLNQNNWFAIGRSGGNGTLNMDGGTINKNGNGNFLVGTGFATPGGGTSVGTIVQSGGTINCGQQFLIPESSPATGTCMLSGTAVLNVSDWIAVGRNGGTGELDISGGAAITHMGGGNLDVGAGAPGTVNQNGGVVTNAVGQTWIGENSSATWNLNSGVANLGTVHIAQTSSGAGTLNVNGGSLIVAEVTSGDPAGSSTLSLNGGAILAANSTVNFIHDLSQGLVGSGGAIFDSQGFDVAVSQSLLDNGGGGLTKNGAGTLTLSGANGYTGATVVNAGTLATTTASTGGGSYAVANGAGLGVQVTSANAQLSASSATLASTTAASLNFDLGAFGNPSAAPLNVSGNLAVNGTITVNIADSLPQIGQFPLVKYGTKSGSGSFVIGSLPVGVAASIVNNTGNNSIDLNITAVNLPRWNGQTNGVNVGVWDIGGTTNWINIGTGLPTSYGQGNFVLFDDNAFGTTSVNLVTTVNPGGVTVSNSILSYTISGAGKISGPGSVTKSGLGTLAIRNTANDYSGRTIISGGTLSLTNLANGGSPSSIGAASASPTNLVLANGTLSYSGASVTANRGFTIANTNSTIDAESNFGLSGRVTAVPNPGIGSAFVKTGPAQFTLTTVGTNEFANGYNPGIQVSMGTMLFDGSAGGQTNHTVNEMWVGGTPNNGASVILSNTTLNVDSWLGLGRGNGTINNTSTITLYNSKASFGNVSLGYANGIVGNLASQFLTLNSSSLTNHGDQNLGESGGSTATIALNGTSVLWCQNRCFLGLNGNSTGTVAIANSSLMVINNGWFSIGNGNNASGSLLVQDSGSVFVSGDFNVTDTGASIGSVTVQGSAVASGNTFLVGKNGGALGTVTMSGGTIIARGGDTWIGGSGSGTMNQTGGTLYGTNWISIGRNGGGVGIYNLSGGSLVKVRPNGTRLNVAENGTGTLNVSGTGSVVVGLGGFADLDICSGNGNGTVNLNGGSITAGQVTHLGSGTATFNFNGGTLAAGTAANPAFLSGLSSANVMSGGATIDSGTNTIGIGQALLDGGGGGGLTKLGSGTLNLNGANTYTGTTLVSAGILGGIGSISGPLNVAINGTVAPGMSIGTFTVNNSVTLGGTATMEISKNGGVTTSDLLAVSGNLAFGGTLNVVLTGTNALAYNDTFTLFSWSTRSGSFATVNLPAGYIWDTTQLSVNGSVRVNGVTPPRINPAAVASGKLILTGVGGPPGAGYTWLTSTSATAPIGTWSTAATGTFNGSAGFSNAFQINTSEAARFFRLRTP